MQRLVAEGRSDPAVSSYARWVIDSAPHLHPVEAVFRHVQGMPYAYDEEIVAARGIDPDTSELLQGAPLQVAKSLDGGPQSVVGDCDDRAILAQSLLESQGYGTRFVLVRGPGRPDYSHVYSEVSLDGAWVPLDTIMDGKGGRPLFGPGEEVGPPDARDRMSVGVDGLVPTASGLLVIAAIALFLWRRR
jgi:hypothetical protein